MVTPQQALDRLFVIVLPIRPLALKRTCNTVLQSPEFFKGYGSSSEGRHAHHNYSGGLVVHTYEVVEIALAMAKSCSLNVDLNVLRTAAVWHDYMKIRDYDSNGLSTGYRNIIRHLSGSFAEFVSAARKEKVASSVTDAVGHCILAHHGRKEWGSPVEPITVEAQILHFADMLSMEYGTSKWQSG